LDDFYTAYLDNIIIYSEDPLKHKCYVQKVLDRLRKAGLQVDIRKFEFSVTRTKFLGFIVFTNSIKVNPEKVAIIKNWKEPTTIKGI
jgi:hypothetical protein